MVEEGSTTLMAGEKVMIGELETTKFVTGVLRINMSRKICPFLSLLSIKVLPGIVGL